MSMVRKLPNLFFNLHTDCATKDKRTLLFPIQKVGAISESRPFVSRELEFPLTDSNESFS